MRTRRIFAGAMALAAGCIAAVSAGAADTAYDVSLGAGHSDNIRRAATDEEDETIAAAGLRFSVDQRSPRLQANAVGNFSYDEYLDDTYDAELQGNFAGNARFGIVPQRFEWVASDNFGQVLSDPFAPQTPDNRENINYFATGPDLTLAFGSRTRLRLGARYALATYEDSPLDFDTKLAEVALVRLLSAASSISLNARAAQTEYDEAALNADYDQREAFVRFDALGARTQLTLDVGYTEIDRDAAADTEDGVLLRLTAARKLTASSTATLTAGREFANSGSAFAAGQAGAGVGLEAAPGLQTAQPFTNDYASLGWTFSRNRTDMALSVSWSDQSYDSSPLLDQTLSAVRGDFRRQLSARTRLSFGAQYAQAEFAVPASDYDEWNAGTAFEWQLSQAVSFGARYDYFSRDSDVPTAEYSENRFWVYLQYGRGEPRAVMSPPEFGIDRQTQTPR